MRALRMRPTPINGQLTIQMVLIARVYACISATRSLTSWATVNREPLVTLPRLLPQRMNIPRCAGSV